LAPGWLHGCLGLWLTLQKFSAMQRIKRSLAALVILVPVLAAAGFLRMTSEVLTVGPQLPTSPDALLHKTTLASWNAHLVEIYLGAVFSAFLFGRLHSFLPRFFRFGPLCRETRFQTTRLRLPRRNTKRVVIAKDVAELLGENNLTKQTALTERGEINNGRGDAPNRHDILTGSKPDGTAFAPLPLANSECYPTIN
jgi:hypothetical protein